VRLVKFQSKDGPDVWINRDVIAMVYPNGNIINEVMLRMADGHNAVIVRGTVDEVIAALKGAE
jgi:hypothetical protein